LKRQQPIASLSQLVVFLVGGGARILFVSLVRYVVSLGQVREDLALAEDDASLHSYADEESMETGGTEERTEETPGALVGNIRVWNANQPGRNAAKNP
jgi:hypothetical protein